MGRGTLPVLGVVLAAVAVGCGGGGGGGTTSSDLQVTGGSSGGAGSSTTGTVIAGGTTGSASTTGTATTGGATTGTASTTGTGTAGTTTAGGTTSSGSTGSATTGGTTTTGSTGGTTTGGAATSGSTTGGATTGGATGATYARPNAIYFGHYGDMSVVSSVLPDGSGRVDTPGGDPDVLGAVPDPLHAGWLVYAKAVDGSYGIYRGATFNVAASTLVAAPVYEYVSTLQATADGAVTLVASQGGTSKLFRIAGGTIATIDAANDASVSVDGTRIAYTKSTGLYDDLFVWSSATGLSTALNTGADASLPSLSKDGAWILFSTERDHNGQGGYEIYQIPSAGGAPTRLTNSPGVGKMGACYNESRTAFSFVGIGQDPSQCGVFVTSNSGTTCVASDTDVNLATYWTDSNGRSINRSYRARLQRLLRKR